MISSVGFSKRLTLGITLMLLAGCQTLGQDKQQAGLYSTATLPPTSIMESIPEASIDTEAKRLAAEGIHMLDTHDYANATEAFNLALKLDISNSYLHFLTGLSYHLRAKREESQHYPLAEEGYKLALKFDQSNWLARYYLGLIYMDQRKFSLAQQHLAQAVLYRADDPEVLYQLASASYYAQDLRTAEAALGTMRRLDLTPDWQRKLLRVSALNKAALHQTEEADRFFNLYRETEADSGQVLKLLRRVNSWTQTHEVADNTQLAQSSFFDEPVSNEEETEVEVVPANVVPEQDSFGISETGSGVLGSNAQEEVVKDFVDAQMAVVEVTIIRTEEDISTSKGINLLSGLQIQFGDINDGTPALSTSRNTVFDRLSSANDAVNTRTITNLISIPAISYSLNIANSQNGRNEVLARPTLVARSGQTSEFFSGVEVAAAATSGGAGDSVSIEKEIGVKLSVTPEFLPNNTLLLNVSAERTFLTQPSRSVEFQFRLDTSKTNVNANIAMKFGQTLILSGLSERETENNRDGVPGLQDIPGVQYLFSRATTRNFRKSVLILMTPRKAQYLHEPEKDRERRFELMSEQERARSLLEQKYSDWFDPLPATGQIFQHLQTNALYQNEFRTGDFPIEKWNSKQTHEERLREIKDFLYY